MSLRYLTVLTVFFLEVVMVGLVLWQVLGLTFDRTAAQIEDTDRGTLSLLSELGKTALLTREYEDLQIQFEQVSRDPHIATIFLLLPDGRIVASNDTAMVGRRLFQKNLPGVNYWLRREITGALGRIGEIATEFSNTALLKSNTEARNLGFAIAGVSMTLIAAVGLLLGFAINRRLHGLAGAADRAATGDYSNSSEIRGRDEIACVGRSFDLMLEKTRESLTALNQETVDRKHADVALRESEERFRSVVNHAPVQICIKDIAGRYILVNRVAEQLFGMTDEEARGKTSFDIFSKEQAAAFRMHDMAVLEADHAIEQEEEWVGDEGVQTFLTVKFPFRNTLGETVAIGAIGTNITARVQGEETLRESEERLRLSLESGQIGMFSWNIQDGTHFWDNRMHEIWGLEAGTYLGAMEPDFLASVHPEDVEQVHEAIGLTLDEDADYDIEYRIVLPDQEIRHVHALANVLRDSQGRPRRLIGVCLDITERKQAEDALRESEERFRLMAENIREIFWIRNQITNEVAYISPAVAEIWGVNPQILYTEPRKFMEAIHPEDRDRVAEAYSRQLEGNYDEQYRIIRPDGTERWIHDRAFPVRNDEDHVQLVVGLAEDITARRAAEEQLRQAQKMETVGQLTGGMAHDFNNLLGIILGNAQLLENKFKGDDIRELLSPLIQATRRGAELTHRLLAFSRQQPLNPRAIDIGALCQGMMDLLRRTLGETIEIEVRIGEPMPARADPGQLENALLNLALNARDAMPEGGKLTIETETVTLTGANMDQYPEGQPGDYVVLKVSDSGSGMAPNVLEKVFEPFFTTKEVGAGSGLGLSMVYGFAQQSGGHVTIESEVGRGTTVALYLPQTEAVAGEDAQSAAAGEAIPKGQGETVLVVEDDPALRRVTVRQLEGLGYHALQAPDGPVALAILADSSRIDLLLSDVVLPGGLNGPEIYQQTKEQRSDLRCLFMSGYAATPEETLPEGVDLLSKPIDIARLARTLRSVLVA